MCASLAPAYHAQECTCYIYEIIYAVAESPDGIDHSDQGKRQNRGSIDRLSYYMPVASINAVKRVHSMAFIFTSDFHESAVVYNHGTAVVYNHGTELRTGIYIITSGGVCTLYLAFADSSAGQQFVTASRLFGRGQYEHGCFVWQGGWTGTYYY